MSKVYGNQRLNPNEICRRQSREIVELCMAGGHFEYAECRAEEG